MKRSITLLLMMCFAGMAWAQNSNVVFFCQEGEPFYVILNGLRQNDEPLTSVRISDITPTAYKVKIIFANGEEGEMDKNVFMNPGTEVTFNIKKKKVKSGGKAMKFSSNDGGSATEKWVMRLQSEVPLDQAPPPPPNQTVIVYHTNTPASTPPPTTTTNVVVTEQTTTMHSNPPAGTVTENVNIGMNMGGDAFGLNMNVNTTGTSSNTSTTYTETTTTTSGGGHHPPPPPPPPAYQMPGYSGAIGCPMPMSESEFRSAKNSISSKSFDDTRLQIAKQIINSNCLTSGQVKDVMMIFSFEDSKLDFAKYAYGYTYDLGNYYKVNDAFDFESSIDELNNYIDAR